MTDQRTVEQGGGAGLKKRVSWFKPLEIETPLTAAGLDHYYAYVRDGLVSDMAFLRRPIAIRRFWSNVIKALGLIALAVGVLMPILKPGHNQGGGPSGAEIALVAVAVGGLLLLLDRLFNISGSWTRLMLAELQVQKLLIGLQFDWAKARPKITDATIESDGAAMIDLLRAAAVEANAVMEAQKRNWSTELDTAAAALAARLESQESALNTIVAKQQEDRKPGGLNVKIDKPGDLEGSLRILVNGVEKAAAAAPQASFAIVGIAPGLTQVKVLGRRKAPKEEFRFETAIDVPADALAEVAVPV